MPVDLAINFFLFLFIIFKGVTNNKRQFLYALSFVLPLQAIGFTFSSVLISWYKLITVIGIIVWLLTSRKIVITKLRGYHIYVVFVLYLTVLTGVLWILKINDISGSGTFFQASLLGWQTAQVEYRYLVQYFSYLFVWGIVLISIFYVEVREDLVAIYNGYIDANIFSILVGLYQMLAIKYDFGIPNSVLFKGWATGALLNSSSVRLYGLGGEPKHTVAYIMFALVLLLVLWLYGKDMFPVKYKEFKLLILVVGLFLTASTGGIISLASLLVILFINLLQMGVSTSLSLW